MNPGEEGMYVDPKGMESGTTVGTWIWLLTTKVGCKSGGEVVGDDDGRLDLSPGGREAGWGGGGGRNRGWW